MTTDPGGGLLIDPGDPAARVATRVSAHALARYAERARCGGRALLARSLLAAMREAVRGVLAPHLCASRDALHDGQTAEFWISGQLVLVVVEGRSKKGEHEGRVLATVYAKSPKYLTPEEMERKLIHRQPDQRLATPRRLGGRRPPRDRRRHQ